MSYSQQHLLETAQLTALISAETIETMVQLLKEVKENKGRIFFLGVGGSASNAGHAVNDFRKLAGIESYAPTDNVAELTARTNDEGWETVFSGWLKVSNLNSRDCLFILDYDRPVQVIGYDPALGAKTYQTISRVVAHDDPATDEVFLW